MCALPAFAVVLKQADDLLDADEARTQYSGLRQSHLRRLLVQHLTLQDSRRYLRTHWAYPAVLLYKAQTVVALAALLASVSGLEGYQASCAAEIRH